MIQKFRGFLSINVEEPHFVNEMMGLGVVFVKSTRQNKESKEFPPSTIFLR